MAVVLVVVVSLVVLVFGFGEQLGEVGPQTAFHAQEESGLVTFTHMDGETVDGDHVAVTGAVLLDDPAQLQAGDSVTVLPLDEEVELVYRDGETSAILHRAEVSQPALALVTLDGEILREGDSLQGSYPRYANPAAAGASVTFVVDEPGTRVEFTLAPGEERTPTGDGTSNAGQVQEIAHEGEERKVTIRIDS